MFTVESGQEQRVWRAGAERANAEAWQHGVRSRSRAGAESRDSEGAEIWQWRCSGHFIVPAQSHKRQRCTCTAADRLHACARKYQNRSKKPDPVRE